MDKLLDLLQAFEPVIVAGLGVLGAVLAPLAAKKAREHLAERHLRLVYDVAKAIADTFEPLADATDTQLDDAAIKIVQQVEDQLGRSLSTLERKAVKRAVAKSSKARAR